MPIEAMNHPAPSPDSSLADAQRRRFIAHCLWGYAALVLVLTALSWGTYVASDHLPLFRPLFTVADRHCDLLNYREKVDHLAEGGAVLGSGFPVYNYPPMAAFVFAFFLRGFPNHPVAAYVAVPVAVLFSASFLLWRSARTRGYLAWALATAIGVTAVLGFPMMYTIDRGNLALIVALALGIGLVLFLKRHFIRSSVFVALASSIKPFPGLVFFLFWQRRMYRELAVGIAVLASLTLAALTTLGPTPKAAYRGIQAGVHLYSETYIFAFRPLMESRLQHSIIDALKSIPTRDAPAPSIDRSASFSNPGSNCSAAVATGSMKMSEVPTFDPNQLRTLFVLGMALSVVILGFVLLACSQAPVLNQLIMLSAAISLLPPVSAEYTVLHLYVPFGAFLLFLVRDVANENVMLHRPSLISLLLLFALLFSPLTFFGRYAGDAVTVVLLTLIFVAAKYRLPSSLFPERPLAQPDLPRRGRQI